MPVINYHNYKSTEALQKAFGDNWMYVGRANQFVDSPRKRGRVVNDPIEFYRQWLWSKIKAGDKAVLNALRQIDENTALVCWCAPAPCHGTVIELAAAWLRGSKPPLANCEIKAITLWQPWATLMALGLKRFETRSWATNYRGLLAIHAAARPVRWESEVGLAMASHLNQHGFYGRDDFPYKAIVGVGKLMGCYATSDDPMGRIVYGGEIAMPPSLPEFIFGNYAPGRFAWHVPDVVGFKEPIYCSGAQGLWTPDDEVRTQVMELYQRAREAVG